MYIVIEIQNNADGTVGTLVWSYDSQQAAESQFHTVLASAAVSNLPKHAAIMISEEGFPMRHECYKHTPVGSGGEESEE